jgi:hypothetical protein
MMGHLIRLAGVLLVAGLATGCGSGHSVEDGESALAKGYLESLDAAGIRVTVMKACRYQGPVDAPWHLSVELRLDAEPGRVAEVLVDEGVVVVRDRDPMIVQQVHNEPASGWNGALEASAGGSVLNLTYNNAKPSGRYGALGWAEECPQTA